MSKARYIMIGGFLGAGKTTTVLRLAEYLDAKGLKVGLITNDQAQNLVDTRMLSSHGFNVEEIAGGAFAAVLIHLKMLLISYLKQSARIYLLLNRLVVVLIWLPQSVIRFDVYMETAFPSYLYQ